MNIKRREMVYSVLFLVLFAVVVIGISALVAWGVARATKSSSSSGTGFGATGPKGSTGAEGDGPTGQAGADGATGQAGADGATGQAGATGSQGLPGAATLTGATGVDGSDGSDGKVGATGPVGIGATGPVGIGATGSGGQQGPIGPTGLVTLTGWTTQTFAEQYLLISDSHVPIIPFDTGFVNPMGVIPDYESSTGMDIFWMAVNTVEVSLDQNDPSKMVQYSYSYSPGGTGSVNLLQTVFPTGPAALTDASLLSSTGTGFVFGIPGGATGPARMIASDEFGRIFAYNPTVASFMFPVINNSPASSYFGCEVLNNILYVANWKSGYIEMYDTTFSLVGTFTDPNTELVLDDRFHPFSLHEQDGLLFVAFVQNDGDVTPTNHNGNSVLNLFLPNGTLLSRYQGGSYMNSPWGFEVVPASKAPSQTREIWIASYGGGVIQRFEFSTGAPYPLVQSITRDPMQSPYIWDLYYPTIANQTPGTPLQVITTQGITAGTAGILRVLVAAPPISSP